MDLNQLLYQHQRALMNKRQSAGREDGETYFDLVEYYARRIRERRRSIGADEYRWTVRSGQ
ncbi:hypothetical protein [Erythrobacter sp. THAF29]|uniref:hypothetical protein n=1 Tax=Erythrobacter sp. THAF29 TaxID=2587851 RepID=UPI0012695C88|nr:hypothetical protein [Erythrobacter sp. THAF29]QFT78805.1 hypothetical protein FIU90_14740 [Erythrobacter sp. THAF29]